MRINKFLARATGMSRRRADEAINALRVTIGGKPAVLGDIVNPKDEVRLDGKKLSQPARSTTIMLNKPPSYIVSRTGQGGKTIYDLVPARYHHLKPVGRLDKDSSGLLLMSDDGALADRLTHPRYQKDKVYRVKLNKTLSETDNKRLLTGVKLSDGMSKFLKLSDCSDDIYEAVLKEGRNRQIRRTFNAIGYKVLSLERISFGDYRLSGLKPGLFKEIIV